MVGGGSMKKAKSFGDKGLNWPTDLESFVVDLRSFLNRHDVLFLKEACAVDITHPVALAWHSGINDMQNLACFLVDDLPQTTVSLGGRDSSVVRALDSGLKGRGFESLQERWEIFFSRVNFLC